MGEQNKNQNRVHTIESEVRRTAHWWFSKRGPAFLDALVQLGDRSIDIVRPYIQKGQIVADIGCGWGRYAFKLADLVGPAGKVYAIDLAEKCVKKIQQKAKKRGIMHIEAHVSSASNLDLLKNGSIDFVFANGLLCSMAIEREEAISEIKRILKPKGFAYLSLGATPPMGYVDESEWNAILEGFRLEQGGAFKEKWALVSLS